MDLFRSKKRGTESASLGEMPESLQKRHRNMVGSVDNLLEEDSQDEVFSDLSTSESESEEIHKASKVQKIFAKKLIKRDKRKEKEQRKKAEKNLISMDDFLRKQSEFKMWLYEEKSKNAGSLSSPKLKVYFKQFVRQWNKHKLLQKYYKSSTLPDSPRSPLASRELNLLSKDPASGSVAMDSSGVDNKKDSSPLVTFGKTPPKVFKSKRLQLFGSNHDVALISVAPLDSPQSTVVPKKENSGQSEPCQYRVPSIKSWKQSDKELDTPSPQFIGATPYKVSVFSWAVGDNTDCDPDQSLEVCSTETPPNRSHAGLTDQEDWPPPPTEIELTCQSTSDSPHVPPPPPPRVESLPAKSGSGYDAASVMSEGSDYSDPYDKLPDRSVSSGAYQDPVDCIVTVDSENKTAGQPEVKLVLNTFVSSNDEPDSSMYSKPVIEKRLSKEELEEMYAKPIKRHKKANEPSDKGETSKGGPEGGLYAEIMAHLEKKSGSGKDKNRFDSMSKTPESHYESIDDLISDANSKLEGQKKQEASNKPANVVEEMKKLPEFASLNKNKKKTVLAASSDKIYETYLRLGKKANPFKPKQPDSKVEKENNGTGTLKKRHKSQPDISFSDTMHIYDKPDSFLEMTKKITKGKPFLSSFKPVDYSDQGRQGNTGLPNLNLKDQRATSCEENLGMVEPPRTPIIMSTPSFESLCQVTPLGQSKQTRSGSSQSLPTKSASSDNLSSGESFLSMSTTSSLSLDPSDHSGSLHSLHSEKSLSPVPEEVDEKRQLDWHKMAGKTIKNETSTGAASQSHKSTTGMVSAEIPNKCVITGVSALTPGKANAARHGIDLSVYLLKPNTQNGITNSEPKPETIDGDMNIHNGVGNSESNTQTNCRSKLFDTQSRLAIKETLSGLKTKVDSSKMVPKKETERRHTVQTIQEMREGYIIHKKPDNPNQVPNIGLASKVRKPEPNSKPVRSKLKGESIPDEMKEPDSKRHCGEKGQSKVDQINYLETDLDSVIQEKSKPTLKKSKSHSGFPNVGSSNVVTDIW